MRGSSNCNEQVKRAAGRVLTKSGAGSSRLQGKAELSSRAQNDGMRAESRIVAAVLTVLLHLFILSALVRVTAGLVRPPQPPVEQETTADKLHGAGEQIINVDISPQLSTRGTACEGSSYIGVGVTAEPKSERIILVGENTPASRAGLQHDDIVLNPSVWRDAHVDGALLHVVILREGVEMAVSVVVGKICIG